MSKVPTLAAQLAATSPNKIFSTILDIILTQPLQNRLSKVKPAIISFISHPIIKELLENSDAPAAPPSSPSHNLKLQKIQDTLSLLTKAIEGLKKATPTSNKHSAPKPSRQKAIGKPFPPIPLHFFGNSRI